VSKIVEKVLEKIVPNAEEQRRIDRAVDELTGKVEDMIEARDIPAMPILVGSIAKGTHLTNPDIDLFLMFPPSVPKEEIGRIDKEIGRKLLDKPEERYAEHAYISGIWQGFKTDLVPCYRVASGKGRISAVDRTPFHTEYVKEHLEDRRRDDVRLLKQFAKGVGVYGAEAKTQGFSGYLCELLILKYGSFDELVSHARKWKLPLDLWLERRPTKKFDEKFVFVDPVDPGRNVASPVSQANLELFAEACGAYDAEPDERFFFPRELKPWDDGEMMIEIGKHQGTVLVQLPPLDVVDDVLWPQLRKTGVSVRDILEREGFSPGKLTLHADPKMCLMIIDCATAELPASYIHKGPPADSPEEPNFLAKWKRKGGSEPVVRKCRWEVEVARNERTPAEVLGKQFGEVRLGKGFRRTDRPVIVSGQGLAKNVYRLPLTRHLDARRPWER
jgi:tRNA nucleotidyltransferase (CCA-adding enzyme)